MRNNLFPRWYLTLYSPVMVVWLAAVWGLTGGLCVEALALHAHIRRMPKWDWRRPIDQGMVAFVVVVALRVGVGSALAAAFAGSHQVSGPLAAFTLGVAAPVVVERLAKFIPLTYSQDDSDSPDDSGQPAAVQDQSAHVVMPTALDASQDGNEHQPETSDITAGDSDAR
jgi:hypothetical protein